MNARVKRPVRTSSLVLLACLLLVLGNYSLSILRAELSAIQVRQAFDKWASQNQAISEKAWQTAQTQNQNALRLRPASADYFSQEGQLQEWRARGFDDGPALPETRLTALRRATTAYRNMTLRAPASAHAWAHLARLKLLSGEADQEFRHALERAMVLGRQSAGIQLELTVVAVLAWPALEPWPAIREALQEIILLGLLNPQSSQLKRELLDAAGLLDIFCSELGQSPPAPRFNRNRGACADQSSVSPGILLD